MLTFYKTFSAPNLDLVTLPPGIFPALIFLRTYFQLLVSKLVFTPLGLIIFGMLLYFLANFCLYSTAHSPDPSSSTPLLILAQRGYQINCTLSRKNSQSTDPGI